MKPPTRTIRRFACPLDEKAVHIDYLRLRCGAEQPFLREGQQRLKGAHAFIAFAEWDIVLFVPAERLYPDNLVNLYANQEVADAVAGSAGFFNYVWKHSLNTGWDQRIDDLANGRCPTLADVSMLVSVRFTDRFRSRYGIGAELLFCDFLQQRQTHYGRAVELFAVHSVGWNDVTVMMTPRRGEEEVLLEILRDVRYCTAGNCLGNDDAAAVVAASYSHLIGNLERYVETELEFGSLAKHVKGAHLLARVTPAMEWSVRAAYHEVAGKVASEGTVLDKELHTELGHYNFSADITWAFHGQAVNAPNRVIQDFRKEIGGLLKFINREYSSFAETTTKITFVETIPRSKEPPRTPIPLLENYRRAVRELGEWVPEFLHQRATNMARHRLAIFLGSVSTYLADPVRGSVVGHLCQFLMTTFKPLLERIESDEMEDLCHVLEYALNQATDGLGQFQHDANSLGLSGRGGYVRVIQAMNQWIADLLERLRIDLMPLVTYGLHHSHSTTAVPHRIDIPFSTAFAPARWSVLFHEIGHLCWHDLFGWRLESLDVWKKFTENVALVADGGLVRYRHAITDASEIFPNYMLLNIAAGGDLKRMDRLLLYQELWTVPRRSITPSLRRRLIVHALLALHGKERPMTLDDVLRSLPDGDVVTDSVLAGKLDVVGTQWWTAWSKLAEAKDLNERVERVIESAITAFEETMSEIAEGRRRRSEPYAPTTELIPSGKTFKDEVTTGVRMCLELMAALARDQEARRDPARDPDPTYASFGEVLARIDRSRLLAEETHVQWQAAFQKAASERFVFADIPPATLLARLLTDLEIDEVGHSLLPSLSVILSLWHRGVTSLLMTETENLSAELEARGLIRHMV